MPYFNIANFELHTLDGELCWIFTIQRLISCQLPPWAGSPGLGHHPADTGNLDGEPREIFPCWSLLGCSPWVACQVGGPVRAISRAGLSLGHLIRFGQAEKTKLWRTGCIASAGLAAVLYLARLGRVQAGN